MLHCISSFVKQTLIVLCSKQTKDSVDVIKIFTGKLMRIVVVM